MVGITDVVFGRVREAIRFLGLISPDGRPTDTLRAIAGASDDEYRTLLAGAIRNAYRDDFERVDPGQDTQAQIVNAFQRYEPRSQTSRMVMLFLGLCREAGIPVLDAPRERQMRASLGGRPQPARSRRNAPPLRRASRLDDPPPPGVLSGLGPEFGVSLSDDDLASLEDAEFDEVWMALGRVVRARARARARANQAREAAQEQTEGSEA